MEAKQSSSRSPKASVFYLSGWRDRGNKYDGHGMMQHAQSSGEQLDGHYVPHGTQCACGVALGW